MAFIREYGDMSGDPFRFRLPRGLRNLRRLKVGRFLGSVANLGSQFIPGVGALTGAARGLTARGALQSALGQGAEFARGYGFDLGDPPPSGHHLAHAMAPPTHKAAKVHAHHQRKLAGAALAAHTAKHGGHGKKKGGGGHGGILAAGSALDAALRSGNIPGLLGTAASNVLTGHPDAETEAMHAALGGHGGMHRHRRINPTNVKALKRSLRRLDGFEKLVKSITKAKWFRVHGGHARVGQAVHRGHKPGCGCFSCKRGK